MHTEYSFNGMELQKNLKIAFARCAKDIEGKIPHLRKLHFSIKRHKRNGGRFEIDLRAVSNTTDVVSTIETKNVIWGLKALKHATINKLREDKKKIINRHRKKVPDQQLSLLADNYSPKTA